MSGLAGTRIGRRRHLGGKNVGWVGDSSMRAVRDRRLSQGDNEEGNKGGENQCMRNTRQRRFVNKGWGERNGIDPGSRVYKKEEVSSRGNEEVEGEYT